MEHITYKTKGVCSRQIDMEIDNGVIVDAKFKPAYSNILGLNINR